MDANIATYRLWEVVGTPAEAIFSGDEMAYEISCDQDNTVDEIAMLKKKQIMESVLLSRQVAAFCVFAATSFAQWLER